MNEFKYTLDTRNRKSICPCCGKKRFVKYIDTVTGEFLPEKYGRCDRECNCGYHLNPYKDGYAKGDVLYTDETCTLTVKPIQNIAYIT